MIVGMKDELFETYLQIFLQLKEALRSIQNIKKRPEDWPKGPKILETKNSKNEVNFNFLIIFV